MRDRHSGLIRLCPLAGKLADCASAAGTPGGFFLLRYLLLSTVVAEYTIILNGFAAFGAEQREHPLNTKIIPKAGLCPTSTAELRRNSRSEIGQNTNGLKRTYVL